ncbi:MAG: chromosomal replication initiator protein DnaA [Proteobacteria bacterium]|nr:chromosomal replication initiator protein DnaA [Pseudomonadota bacterium]
MADVGSFQNRVEALDLPEGSSFLDSVTFLSEKKDLFEKENKELAPSLWETIQEALKKEFGKSSFDTWFKHLEIVSFEEERFVLSLPTLFLRDWISTHYGSRLKLLLRQIIPSLKEIDFIVIFSQEEAKIQETPLKLVGTSSSLDQNASDENEESFYSNTFGGDLDPRFTFENFIVGKPNELAYAAALRVAEEKNVTFNPLFLYGGVGLGKTHLMHAIAWKIRQLHPKRRFIYLSAEKFMYQFIRALRHKDTMAFKEQFRSVDVLMIDDVQFICGKESTQEEFFHTFNALVDQNRQIIVSADKSPSDLNGIEERMRSRLGWGLVADIHPTTYELRLGILQSKAETMKLKIPGKVMEFIAHKISSNVRELEGALTRIAAHSSFVGREITLEMTQDVLKDLLRANDRRITLDDIQKRVSERYNIKLSDFQSLSRARMFARPRQIAMYLAKTLTTKSFPDIGRAFGGRDHTTVVHAVKTIDKLKETDSELLQDLEFLTQMLQS